MYQEFDPNPSVAGTEGLYWWSGTDYVTRTQLTDKRWKISFLLLFLQRFHGGLGLSHLGKILRFSKPFSLMTSLLRGGANC